MLLVGLTGNIGSGKSSVARLLAQYGATIIDSDVLAREAVEVGTPAHRRISGEWGEKVLAEDGHLDRGALRKIVFSDPEQLETLNQIVHPEVERRRDELIAEARARGDRIVVCDIPLLFEKRLTDAFDKIVLVDAPRPVRLERIVRDRQLMEAEAMEMIASQMPAELKRARADLIIENAGTMDDLARRVRSVWQSLREAADAREGAGVP